MCGGGPLLLATLLASYWQHCFVSALIPAIVCSSSGMLVSRLGDWLYPSTA